MVALGSGGVRPGRLDRGGRGGQDMDQGGGAGFSGLVAKLWMFRARLLGGEPSDRALARAARVSPTTIGKWLSGEQFPQDDGQFLAVVRAVAAEAAARGMTPAGRAAGVLDEDRWRTAYRAENQRRAGVVSVAVQRARAGRALAGPPAGWLLGEVRDPFALEVHRPVQPEDAPAGLPELPAYVPRGHDAELAGVVRAAAEGRSGVAVLVGGSSTGKTRACWEALGLLRDQEPEWRLWHPIDPSRPDAALAELPRIGPRTVVWLNEAQLYLDPAEPGLGERVVAGLRQLLRDPGRAPVLVLASLWQEFWDTLTVRPDGDADLHAQARELLAGRDITVPAAFTAEQVAGLAGAGDARLVLAGRSAADGQVVQFLAGAPELEARYRNAPSAARAVIDAAMDARRLGVGIGLPRAFLEHAADGYLTDDEWDGLREDWLEQALAYTARSCKGARGPLTLIRPRPGPPALRPRDPAGQPGAPSGPGYRLADWLDQHGRARRAGLIPPAQFWAAAAVYTLPGDQAALGDAAAARGLYRAAAQLHKNAAACGDPRAAAWLAQPPPCLRTDPRPTHWAAAHASLDDPRGVAVLLDGLRKAGGGEQVAALAVRAAAHAPVDDPAAVAVLLDGLRKAGMREQAAVLAVRAAAHASLDDLFGLAVLLDGLRKAGAGQQVAALAARAAAHASLDDPGLVSVLLRGLWGAGAERQAAVLAARATVHVALDDPGGVGWLLEALRAAGAEQQAAVLAARAAAHAPLDDPGAVAVLLDGLRKAGMGEQAAVLAARAAAHAPLNDPGGVGVLLDGLRTAGMGEQAAALAARDPAVHAPLDDLRGVAVLLDKLRKAGMGLQAAMLAARAVVLAPLDDPYGVAWLLNGLRGAGAEQQAAALLARDPAAHVALDDPGGVGILLGKLRAASAQQQAAALAARAAAYASLDKPAGGVIHLLDRLRAASAHQQAAVLVGRLPAAGMFDLFLEQERRPDQFRFGREPDGTPATPWDWDDLD
jgi:hypothetical protein